MLPTLFLLSAAATGTMAVALLAPGSVAPFEMLSKVLLALLILKTILVIFYIQASHRTDESRASAHLLLKGRLSGLFWFGLIVVGLLGPIALLILNVTTMHEIWLTRTAAILGLLGGFILRRLVLAAGVRAPLRAAGIEFTFPSPIVR
jgi:formate-dependent nitrite reductase membrane component NrfD